MFVVVKLTADTGVLLHNTWSPGLTTCPVGFTVIVNVLAAPSHVTEPFVKCGVTTIVAITGKVPLLVAVNVDMSPVPPDPRPIMVVLLVHV